MQEPPDPLAGLIQVLPEGVSLSVPTRQIKAKLPKLVLPKFRGEVTTWMGFWYSYKSAVHDNVNLSKIDKFNYLRSLLEGAASQAIQGLALSSDNYDSAVEILEQRFGKTQQIISAHMEEILKLQPSLTDCPSSLHFLYDKLSVHVQGLSSLGVSSQECGSLLIPIIMSKLSNEIRLKSAWKSTNEVLKIDQRGIENRPTRYGKSVSCWTQSKKSKRVKPVRLSIHRKSRYENRQTRVHILHDWFPQRIHYLWRKAKNFGLDVFTAMENNTQLPVWRFNKWKNEETFFKGIIDVLFASKLAMLGTIVSKQRDADTVMESITNRFAQNR